MNILVLVSFSLPVTHTGSGGLPIALFSDGEDLDGSGSGTPSENDDEATEDEEVEDAADAVDGDASGGSWEDVEDDDDES